MRADVLGGRGKSSHYIAWFDKSEAIPIWMIMSVKIGRRWSWRCRGEMRDMRRRLCSGSPGTDRKKCGSRSDVIKFSTSTSDRNLGDKCLVRRLCGIVRSKAESNPPIVQPPR